MGTIFISYRRDDTQGEAGHLLADLRQHFGKDRVFMDVVAIRPGEDFRKAIDQAVASCDVMLVLIGKEWANSKSESGERRLEDPRDFVRIESATALRRDVRVIPVLVQGAAMPKEEELPEDLKSLVWRNSIEISHNRWNFDVGQLTETLESAFRPTEAAAEKQGLQSHGKPNEIHRGSFRKAVWSVGGLVLLAAGLLTWRFWPKEIVVPDLTGMPIEEARAQLGRTGFALGLVSEEPSEGKLPGTIIRQMPAAGKAANKDQRINLVVASKRLISVPDVTGKPLEMAKLELSQIGLTLGALHSKQVAGKTPGEVLSQSLKPGEQVEGGKAIDLVVAAKTDFRMPDVVGKSDTTAQAILEKEMGLRVQFSREAYTLDADIGTVLKQSPAAGELLKEGQIVRLRIAGKPGAIIPKVVGKHLKDAQAMLEKARLKVGAVNRVETSEVRPDYVLKQALAPDEVVSQGKEIDLVVGAAVAMTTVPDFSGLSEKALRDLAAKYRLRIHPAMENFLASNPGAIAVFQSLKAGARVPAGTVIDFKWSRSGAVPTLISPKPGTLMDNGCRDHSNSLAWTFSWAAVPRANRYHLYVIGPGAKNPAINDESLVSTSHQHERGTSYIVDRACKGWRWKVRAEISDRWTEWSTEGFFDVEPVDSDCKR